MGYLKAGGQDTDRLSLPSDPEFYVLMRRRARYGDQLAAQAAVVKVDAQNPGASLNGDTVVDTAAYVRVLISRLIVDWNLTDEQEQPLPCTVEVIEQLAPEDGQFLADEANRRVGGRSQTQAAPFKNGSGQRSTATASKTLRSKA